MLIFFRCADRWPLTVPRNILNCIYFPFVLQGLHYLAYCLNNVLNKHYYYTMNVTSRWNIIEALHLYVIIIFFLESRWLWHGDDDKVKYVPVDTGVRDTRQPIVYVWLPSKSSLSVQPIRTGNQVKSVNAIVLNGAWYWHLIHDGLPFRRSLERLARWKRYLKIVCFLSIVQDRQPCCNKLSNPNTDSELLLVTHRASQWSPFRHTVLHGWIYPLTDISLLKLDLRSYCQCNTSAATVFKSHCKF